MEDEKKMSFEERVAHRVALHSVRPPAPKPACVPMTAEVLAAFLTALTVKCRSLPSLKSCEDA
jgi:hypothetical protein